MAKLVTEIQLKVNGAKAELEKLDGAIKKGDGDVASMKQRYKELEKELQNSDRDIRAVKKATEDTKKSFSSFKDSIVKLATGRGSLSDVKEKFASLKNNFSSLSSSSGGAVSALMNLTGATTSLGVAVNFATAGIGLIVAGVAALGSMFVAGAKTTMEYQSALSELKGVSRETDEGMSELEAKARELGGTTRYTATEVVNLMTVLARLGKTKDQILSMSESTLKLAQGMKVDLAESAKLVGSTLNVFQLDAKETNRVTDVLAAATTKSALGFSDLTTALAPAGTASKAFGASIEFTTAALGKLVDNGIDASSAGTQLRNVIGEAQRAGSKLNKLLGDPKDPETFIKNLKRCKNGALDYSSAMESAGKYSATVFYQLVQNADEIEKLTKELENSKGACDELANTMSDNLEGDLASLSSAWDDLMIQLNGTQSIFRAIVQWLTKVVRGVKNFIVDTGNWFAKLWDESEGFRFFAVEVVAIFKFIGDTVGNVFNDIARKAGGLKKIIEGAFTLDKNLMLEGFKDLNPIDFYKDEWEDWKKRQKEANDLFRSGKTGKEVFAPLIEAGKDASEEILDDFGGLTKGVKDKVEEAVEGSIKYLKDRLATMRELFEETPDSVIRENLRREMKKLQAEIDKLEGKKNRIKVEVEAEIDLKDLNEKLEESLRNLGEAKAREFNSISSAINGLGNSIVSLNEALEKDDGFATFDAFGKMIINLLNDIQSLQKAFESVKKAEESFTEAQAAAQYAQNALSQQSQANAAAEMAVNSAKSASNVAVAGSEMIKAGAEATSSAAGLPFPANLAAITAAISAVLSITGVIKSLGKFANGGIVGGSSSIGDFNIARVNSGEMILNGTQQRNLFNQLNQPQAAEERGSTNANVQFKISGRELVGVLNNYNTFRN